MVWDQINERRLVLLTNHLEFGVSTISAIYKDRWQIEIFFKALKQNLKVETFVDTSENALYIQIWTAFVLKNNNQKPEKIVSQHNQLIL